MEINAALGDGMSVRVVAARFGFGRGSIFRHAKSCLRRTATATAEARAKTALRHKELTGDLDAAYSAALLLQTKAEESTDISAAIKAQRHVARLLQLRTKAAGKLLPAVSMVPQPQYRDLGFRIIYDFPEELRMFASSARAQPGPEMDVPVIGFRVRWQVESKDFMSPADRAAKAEADRVQAALDLYAKTKAAEELN